MAPFFSVVLPTYNRARLAAAAALSALAQSERDFELFIVDDGSTDDTQRILSVLPRDPRLRLLRMEKNQGQHACRNLAISEAKGEFVSFLDSDDLYLPERLAAFRRAIEERPEAGFWFCNGYLLRGGDVVGRLFDPARKIPQGRVPGYYAAGPDYLPYVTSAVAVRREAFARFGPFRLDMRILEDAELYSRMLAGGLEAGSIAEPLIARRLHEGQITAEHERVYEEGLMVFSAGGMPEPELSQRKRALVLEVADYLWKGAEPARARAFLLRELGGAARGLPAFWKSFLPAPALRALRGLRRAWLKARYGGPFAPAEFRRARALLRPYLDHAARL